HPLYEYVTSRVYRRFSLRHSMLNGDARHPVTRFISNCAVFLRGASVLSTRLDWSVSNPTQPRNENRIGRRAATCDETEIRGADPRSSRIERHGISRRRDVYAVIGRQVPAKQHDTVAAC